jgi:transcriptional regulator with XRE-family HTH domain
MSPTPHRFPISPAAARALARMTVTAGQAIRDERLRRRWTLRELAGRVGVSTAHLQQLEAGAGVSLETYARVATGLDLWPELTASDPRRRKAAQARDVDPVHAAMGELEVGRLREHGFPVAIDEPYQHYQFAGRADVVAWDLATLALLHIENRTRFPDIQDALGSYAAKRSYLGGVLAERLSIPGGRWRSESHVIAALWSAEVLHALRVRTETFKAACPDPAASLRDAWWAGVPPARPGRTSSLVLVDPAPGLSDARRFAELSALSRLRPRYRGYADAVPRLR